MSMDKKLIKAIYQAQSGKRMNILDVGARGGIQWPWNSVPCELIQVALVEPDPIEAERLTKRWASTHSVEVLPFALWSQSIELTININRSAGTSSIFNPNRDFLNQFPDSERFDVLQQLPISAVSLDHLVTKQLLTPPDFMKIDIQGAELEVLKGGRSVLSNNLVGLEVEVEFAQMYENQPLFRHIDQFVQQELGLVLWDLRSTYWRYETPSYLGGGHKGQLIFGDALYLRPIASLLDLCEQFDFLQAKHKVVSLVLSALGYGYFDYTFKILQEQKIKSIVGTNLASQIIESMMIINSRGLPSNGGVDLLVYKFFRRLNNILKESRNNLGSKNFGKFWWS